MQFDLSQQRITELNGHLHSDDAAGQNISVINPGGAHNVAVGAMHEGKVEIDGHVGYYCAGMNANCHVRINGNAGSGLAENMMSGMVEVTGSASQYCGATSHGGLISIHGDAAARCGISMKGSDIVVQGNIGHMSAFMAQTGRLVVLGDTGEALGDSIYEARLYVRGKPASLGADCIAKEMHDEHKAELAELLAQCGISGVDIGDFTRYGSARKLYNFNIDNVGAY